MHDKVRLVGEASRALRADVAEAAGDPVDAIDAVDVVRARRRRHEAAPRDHSRHLSLVARAVDSVQELRCMADRVLRVDRLAGGGGVATRVAEFVWG